MSSKRLKRIVLLAQCLLRVATHGVAKKAPAQIARIIVVPTGKLGDVVCATPVLQAIRTHMPKARIIVAGNSKLHRALLADSGLADEYLDLEDKKDIAARIKGCNADVAIITGPSFEYVARLCAAGIPLVVAPRVVGGFSPSETVPYKMLKKCIKTFPYDIEAYAPRERLRALEAIGIFSEDTKKHLGFSQDAQKKISAFFAEHVIDAEKDFLVAISPSAGNKIKEWPEERFAEVADHVVEKYKAKAFIIGGPQDTEKTKRTLGQMKYYAEALEVSHFNLDELKAFISKLSLFISVDTGPIYVAEAFGIPTVDIVGPVDERVQPPQGLKHRNVIPQRKKAELFILNARAYNKKEAERQTQSISVSDVNTVIDELISDLKIR